MHRYETWVPNSFRFDGEADGRWTRRINGYTSITHGFISSLHFASFDWLRQFLRAIDLVHLLVEL